jgi:hypothetical protein
MADHNSPNDRSRAPVRKWLSDHLKPKSRSSSRAKARSNGRPSADPMVAPATSSLVATKEIPPSGGAERQGSHPVAPGDVPSMSTSSPGSAPKLISESATTTLAPLDPPPETQETRRVTGESNSSGLPKVELDPLGDRAQTEKRYQSASQELTDALQIPRIKWGSFAVPTLDSLETNDPLPQLREYILKILEAREQKTKDKGLWSRCKSSVESAFTATSPFAKNFLIVANNAQSVSAHAKCH